MAGESWLREGASVVEHTYSATGGRFTSATIQRITKTLIVLDNGNRYSRATLRPPGDTNYRSKLMQAGEDQQ